MTDNTKTSLPLTGERFLPELQGDMVPEHLHRYSLACAYVKGKRVLDIASGEGYGSAILCEHAEHVIGVDVDKDSVTHAVNTYTHDNLEFRQGDCAAIPLLEASVDVVVSFETIEHHAQHNEMMAEIKRVLRPDGLLILSSPDKGEYSDRSGYDNPYHVRELYKDQLEYLLESNFKHYLLLGQRMVYGSALFDDQVKKGLKPISNTGESYSSFERPVYFIAFASDVELPEVENSFYQHDVGSSDTALALKTTIHSREMELDQRGERIQELETRQHALENDKARVSELESRLVALESEYHAKETERQAWQEQCRHWVSEVAFIHARAARPVWLIKQLLKRFRDLPAEKRQQDNIRQRIAHSGRFDASWYLETNPDVMAAGHDPLEHYVRYGGFEGRSASKHFDTLEHLRHNPQLWHQRQHPLIHWLDHQHQNNVGSAGNETGALFEQLFDSARGQEAHHVELNEQAHALESRIRAIAFYLPQFHPIAENNEWWGRGFTEWTNVSKAVPQFLGHEQPRLPGELGFYDLRVAEVQERQAELASMHGLEAFCFHYYWFSGRKRLLEKPIDAFASNENIDLPFCVCWANENWTRRWDGLENDVLMAQRYDPEDDLEFIEDLAPLLRNPRYLRVDGKAVLIVYRVDLLPDAPRTANTWREWCREQGIGELHLVAAQSFGIGDPTPYGFDAAVEFPPHDTYANRIESRLHQLNPQYQGQVYDYADLVFKQLAKPRPDYLRYRTVFPAWDNEARKPGRGHVFHGTSPARYQQWLAGACREADRLEGDGKLVFINAWNEWAEGAYLEPDRRYGYAYLSATRKVLEQFPAKQVDHEQNSPAGLDKLAPRRHDTAVVLHLYHTDLWEEIYTSLSVLEDQFDLYVSIPDNAEDNVEKRIQRDVPGATVVRLVNRGRDVAPFLTMLRALRSLGYGQLLKIHSKRSLHRGDGDLWRREFLGKLLGSRANALAIVNAFRDHPEIGMVGPAGHWLDYRRYWGDPDSPARTRDLLDNIGAATELEELGFFAGSMFWCRPEAMAPLLDHITLDDFEPEAGQTDGTLAHALERIFAASCQTAGLRVTDSASPMGSEPAFIEHYPYALTSPPLSADGAVPVNMPASVRTKRAVRHVLGTIRRRLG